MKPFHFVCIHPKTYKEKPSSHAGYISAQIARYEKCVSVEKLANQIGKGQSWTPSTFTKQKRSIETFKQMSIIAVDIDKWNIELVNLLTECDNYELEPIIVHESFTSSKEHRKWRLVFQLEKPIIEVSEVYHSIGVLARIFNADPSCVEPARFLFGTTEDKVHIINPEAEPIKLSWFTNKKTLKIKQKKKVLKGKLREKPKDRIYIQDIPVIKLVVDDCKKLISDPPDSRYQSLWNSARKLAQLNYFTSDQISDFLNKQIEECKDIWDDWDKDIDTTIERGINWGVEHLRDGFQ